MAEQLKNCAGKSDREIILLAQKEVDYFACLFHRYESKMMHYILKISACSTEEGQDILQEAFIKIWKNLHSFDPTLPFSSWLYRIVHNETISYWRKSKTRDNQITLHKELTEYLHPLLDENSLKADDNLDLAKFINKVLEKMKTDYKEVLILKYMENLSYEEISDVLRIPEGTVATRLNRAKKAFIKESNKL